MSAATLETWRALVEKALKGAPLESLTTTTLDGLTIAPLYTERDRPASEGIPWSPRAKRALGRVIHSTERDVLERERDAGATFAWIEVRPDAPPPPEVEGLEILVRSLRGERLGAPHVRLVTQGLTRAEPLLSPLVEPIRAGHPALGVDAAAFHEGGAGAIDEIALSVSMWAGDLRALERHGVDLDRAVGATTFATAVGADFFVEIAKLRALRRVVDRVCTACRVSARPFIAACASERQMARLDAPTNIVRSTLSLAAGLVGGADAVADRPHADGPLSDRLARMSPLILTLESHLAVASDPARGSAAIESLTSEIATRAWDRFQALEGNAGATARKMGEISSARADAVARRRVAMVGVNRFPIPAPTPTPITEKPPLRDAIRYEDLHNRAARARVVVIPGCPEARVDFAREVAQLAAQSVDVVRETARGDASFVLVAAPDAVLGTSAVDAVRELRATGVRAIAIAGKPGVHEAALREAGVDAFVFVGADIVAALETLLDRVEGKGAA